MDYYCLWKEKKVPSHPTQSEAAAKDDRPGVCLRLIRNTAGSFAGSLRSSAIHMAGLYVRVRTLRTSIEGKTRQFLGGWKFLDLFSYTPPTMLSLAILIMS